MPEPKIWKITIEQGVSGASFNPASLTITVNDSVFWANNTPNPHQPAPDNGTSDQWVAQPIPPHGQSSQVVFDSPTPATNPYHCALDPTVPTEKGVIIVNAEN
jgi:plastocyanin